MPGLHDIQNEASFDGVRRKYLDQLAAYTGRDTLVYAAGWGMKPGAMLPPGPIMIVPEDLQGFMTSLHGLSRKNLDLIIHSPGGSSEGAEQIVQYLRSKYDHIRVIVPQNAMSAATMIACAADVIVMGKESALGPIDPQIGLGQGPSVPAQSILDDFEQAKAAVTVDPRLAALFAPKLLSLPHGMLSYCKSAIERSKILVAEWLEKYMHLDHDKAVAAAEWLASHGEHRSHGRPISAQNAAAHGLNILMLEEDDDLQDKVLSIYHSIMLTFNGTECVKIIESHLKPGMYTRVQIQPMMGFPPNMPPGHPSPAPGIRPPFPIPGAPSPAGPAPAAR
jgi:Serine dehydrogenase proteinase